MKKILIIEDDIDLQHIYSRQLKSAGFVSIIAASGEAGLQKARLEHPDLIILDIMLPGGADGLVILKALKKDPVCAPIPVIIATNLEDQVMAFIDAGAVWYFVKAHTPIETLLAKIKSILK